MAKRNKGMMSLPGVPAASSSEPESKVDWIEEMVGALFDPIIVWPSPWQDTIPEWMKKDMPLHRLAHLMRCLHGEAKHDEACDLEALIYMYPRTLEAPLDEEWTRIYVYLGTKVMGDKVPQEMREDKLRDDYERDLRDLKRWIRKKKVEARKQRQRREKAEAKEKEKAAAVVPAKCEQLPFF